MIKLAILMDPIEQIDPNHDSSFAMLLAAQQKNWALFYFQQQDLFSQDGKIQAQARQLTVSTTAPYYQLTESKIYSLNEFDVVLMRKDPPFDMNYIYTTYLLEIAEQQGAWIINNPRSIRDANEKLFTLWFPECCPSTLVSSDKNQIKQFWQQHGEVILKPLDGMGGKSIFFADQKEKNIHVIIETLTEQNKTPIMVQRYLPGIKTAGDKRIIMINGKAVDYALQRIPSEDDIRGNMAAGACTQVMLLTEREQQLCRQIGPVLQQKGLEFVGLDVIDGFVTEINVTSPTGLQELEKHTGINYAEEFIEFISEPLFKVS